MASFRFGVIGLIHVLLFATLFLRCSNDNFAPICGVLTSDVYIAGATLKPEKGSLFTNAAYTKNGKLVILPDAINSENAAANGIAVSGADVYVIGSNGQGEPIYWKNGTLITLSESYGSAKGITISGEDVYIAGVIDDGQKEVGVVWKNGNLTTLQDSSAFVLTTSIAVEGSDVFVAGCAFLNDHMPVAKYWKNGVAVNLTDTTQVSMANSIFVTGQDVYVAGFVWDQKINQAVARYWKNGLPVSIGDGIHASEATSIFVNGSDVYVAGLESINNTNNSVAKYWINGAGITLSDNAGVQLSYACANAIQAFGGNVLVVGSETMPGSMNVAKYWLNSCTKTLTDGSDNSLLFSSSIFLVK